MPSVQHLPERRTASGAGKALKDSPADRLVGEIEKDNKIEGRRKGCEGGIQSLGLDHGAGKAVENEGRAVGVDPGGDNPNDQIIGNKKTARGPGIRLGAKRCTTRRLGAKESTGRDMGNIEAGRKCRGLRPLAGGRGTEKEDPSLQGEISGG